MTTFGAVPALTDAKHRLRDWIEARLVSQPQRIDAHGFGEAIHKDVNAAALMCDDCGLNTLGYMDDVRVRLINGLLVVVTAMGTSCGYDESIYGYAWASGAWKRVWEYERTTYTPREYLPQMIEDVQVTAPGAAGRRLVLLLGSQTT